MHKLSEDGVTLSIIVFSGSVATYVW